MSRSRAYRWLALLPPAGLLGGIPFANRVRPFVLGLPFLLAWIVGWVVLTAVIMATIFTLDRARDAQDARNAADPSRNARPPAGARV